MSIWKSLGPAIPGVAIGEAVRAGVGAVFGLAVTGLFLLTETIDPTTGLYLVAPFGASSVLLFAVPNSPLAQPWPSIVGNTLSAIIGVAVCLSVSDPVLRVALSVGLAITAMLACRAVHPPAGAVAMTAALSPDSIAQLGFCFALAPIALGTVALVLLATVYARITGRHYPMRQFDVPGRHRTEDPDPAERLGLSESELTDILKRYRHSLNLGVEDLARLIGAAELQAAAHATGPLTAADIMSRDLVTVGPEARLSRVADLFRTHRFTSLPVVGADGGLRGVIFQMHLINAAQARAGQSGRGNVSALRALILGRDEALTAGDIMGRDGPVAMSGTPVAALLALMADGDTDAVPVVSDARLVGIVTRTDLIAGLARSVARRG
ncbi:HPP family protein [Paracoccus sp. TK19116]|uniref:HPP family protein n=1 Tax=Paracoccus albicereus TaxID=2922394 RepID=A0ABT1MQX9_9RHOB|nr:HPP family protein [Paracoccus albicereus]MCQ0970539.1 HPP family protein [Paracoccus albicereus]